jgi:hypothetical protein
MPMSDTALLSLEQAKERYTGPLVKVVLDWLTVMDRVVNQAKQPAMTEADWEPLGDMANRAEFRRVGNYGVRNDWESYVGLLTQWANMSWWKCYIWRVREVPGSAGRPSLVYMETEERSNRDEPVTEHGAYDKLASIAVYEIDENCKITRLHVYDQRPL